YLVDIMWETGQGHRTELKAVQMAESERHGYKSRPIYRKSNDIGVPDSLTGWCYEHDQPVWIVDRKGLSRKSSYVNLWHQEAKPVPADTIFEYNQAKICTEICFPLRTSVDTEWSRAAGVLNIEIRQFVYPSAFGKRFVHEAASVIEQLQNQSLS